MSLKVSRCVFFSLLLTLLIDRSSSTSHSTEKAHSSPPPVTNSSNTSANIWLVDALKDIAYYLRAHKFNEYDRRYEPDAKLARREYYRGFPRPPLRSLHWEVHKYCEQSLIECVDYLRKRVRKAGMTRSDDTTVVIQEQQWGENNTQQIEIVDKECRKMKQVDDIQANPFEGPLERFQWRVTASYYMCWYTMKSEPTLSHLSDKCDNFADCLDPEFGPNNRDDRANDAIPYSCAFYSFCPDPCCPIKHLTRPENCWDTPENPCFEANPPGQRECVVDRSRNTDFSDLILNRWNVSCKCREKGLEWSSFYGICVDIDECATGAHACNPEKETCLNLLGSFKCVCKWGHIFNKKSKTCEPSKALTHLMLRKQEEEKKETQETLWLKFLRLFDAKSSTRPMFVKTNLIILFCICNYFNKLLVS
ncbi:uncharacterized protein LOC123007610 [Tribolium madens]|uniref:uncharacterized protein LOC123007610 n=1 Tax=Tribolium madens TaxID=41895 RepID=UPI001CF727AC|nr:uncharacterized protein LOC123007610 [Tribolium madens]